MARILVIHGAGMNMRGKVQTEIFGPMTLPEYDERIRGYAAELGLEVEIFHSNLEGEIVNRLYEANDRGGDLAGQVPDDRGAHLEPDPARPGLTDRRRQPGRRRRLRRRRLRARPARHQGPARCEEVKKPLSPALRER